MNRKYTPPAAPKALRPSQVQQAPAKAADINAIMKRHSGNTSVPPSGPLQGARQPRYFDVPSISYHDALNMVTDAQVKFMRLDGRLRKRWNNDVYQMLRFVENPENRQDALDLGLLEPTPEEAKAIADRASALRVKELRAALQTDLVEESENGAPKADPESQPSYKPPKGGK